MLLGEREGLAAGLAGAVVTIMLLCLAPLAGAWAQQSAPPAIMLADHDVAVQRTVADIVGHTLLHYDVEHGTQVEFYDALGLAYLWYPGNAEILVSHYRLRPGSGEICFSYSNLVYNGERDEIGGNEWCHTSSDFRTHVRETVSGDPFQLQSRIAVPFILDPGLTTFAALRAGNG